MKEKRSEKNPAAMFSARRRGSMTPVLVLFALVVVGLIAFVFYAFNDESMRTSLFHWRLASMKNVDYSGEIGALMKEERYDEAEKFAAFVEANPEMPGQEQVRALRAQTRAAANKDRSMMERGMDLLSGFLSGGGSSTEARIGGLVSNLLINNKAIDESMLPKGTRDDSDKLAAELERANLGMEGRWFPAVMRTLRLSGLMSPEYEHFLLENARASAEAGAPTEALRAAIKNTQKLVTTMGINSTIAVHKGVRNDRDLAELADWGKLYPDETYIVASLGGMPLFSKLPPPPEGAEMLKSIARKGKPAIDSANFFLK